MLQVRFAGAIVALAALCLGAGLAGAQSAADPAAYLPAPAELPAGFVHRDDRTLSLGGATGLVRSYTSPTGILSVGVVLTPNAAAADLVLAQIPSSLQGDGFSFQNSPGLLGDQTLTSTKTIGSGSEPAYSGAAVLFRVGGVVGEAVLLEQPGPVSVDAVLAIARPIAQRAQANPVP
jgi:hypothetical protein